MKKSTIKLIVLGVVCLLIWGTFIIVLDNNNKEKKLASISKYVIIDNLHCWKYQNYEWELVDNALNTDSLYDEINWKKYNIYVSSNYYNTYQYVVMNGKSYFFDDNDDEVDVPSDYLLFSVNGKFKLKEFSVDNINDKDNSIINDVIKKNGYSYSNFNVMLKYSISSNENIYILSNYSDNFDYLNENLYYLVFYRKNNKNYVLVDDIIDLGDKYDYNLAYIVNYNEKNDVIILSYVCEESICYDMFQYVDGKYEKVIGGDS